MRHAIIYKKNGNYLIITESKTTTGALIWTKPYFLLEPNVSKEKIGEIIKVALNASIEGIPHPTDWKKLDQELCIPIISMVGAKTWSQFEKNALSCGIKENEVSIKILPSRNLGKNGFVLKEGAEIVLSFNASNEEIGNAVIKGFESCN